MINGMIGGIIGLIAAYMIVISFWFIDDAILPVGFWENLLAGFLMLVSAFVVLSIALLAGVGIESL